jgi:phenylpropionate dioxygenase-like ring-hydroxylating dioxygenase large terminal subunit
MTTHTEPDPLTFTERGFPWPGYPTGWFQVGWSAELAPGDIRPVHYFGRELVMYRGEDGTLAMLDAFCPHMGAHLGYGGTVEGSCLRCPYHGWVWSADGGNVEIPYGDRGTINARAHAWRLTERAGVVYAWYHRDDEPPSWQPPAFEEESGAGFYDPYGWATHTEPLRMHPQFASENFPDLAHMHYVHRWRGIPEPTEWKVDGPYLRVDYPGTIGTPRGDVVLETVNEAYGVGLNINRVVGELRSTTLGAFTPIDDRTSRGFITMWLPRTDGADQPGGLHRAMAASNIQELFGPTSDRRIWEHMHYRRHPLHVGYETTLTRDYRQWTRQFYPDAAETGTAPSPFRKEGGGG